MNTIAFSSAPKRPALAKLALGYSSVAAGLMLLYFFIVNALGWQRYQEVRFASHVFTVLAVLLAIRAYKAQTTRPAHYLPGLGLGFMVGLFSSLLFAAFIFLYSYVINPAYQAELERHSYFNSAVSPVFLTASITLLGVIIGSLTGYILMMSDGAAANNRFGVNREQLD